MVNYFTEGIKFAFKEKRRTSKWLRLVAESEIRQLGDISVIFCSDPYILDVNLKYLGHDYYTDIITFDYSRRLRIAGDMVISLDTVRSNAQQLGVNYDSELLRVIIHGVLHLCGINDKGPGEREIMERHENEALAIVPENIFAK